MTLEAQTSETSDNISTHRPLDVNSPACIGIDDGLADLAPEVPKLDSEGCYSQTELTGGDQLTEVSPDCAVDRDIPDNAMGKAEEGACELRSDLEEQQHNIQV